MLPLALFSNPILERILHKAWHYAGAVLVVVVGIWVAQLVPNPISGLAINVGVGNGSGG